MTESEGQVLQRRYCSLLKIGKFAALDAQWDTETTRVAGKVTHCVRFRLVNEFGARFYLGFLVIDERPDGGVSTHTGEVFPSVDAAARNYAKIFAVPGRWVDRPIRHDTWDEPVTAFDADEFL